MLGCLYSRHLKLILNHKEGHMQSTNIKGIKAALWEQAFIGGTQVSCSMGQVVAMTPTHMIGDTCCKYLLQEKREFDSEDACFVMYCGSSAWQEEQDRRSFFRALMLCLRKRTTFVMWSRAEKKRVVLCRGHMNRRSRGETWRHRLSPFTHPLRRNAFHDTNYRSQVFPA